MKIRFFRLLIAFLLLIFINGSSAFAQTSQQIKAKKEKLQSEMTSLKNEIAKIELLMKKTTKQKAQNLEQLKKLKQKIKNQEGQIAQFNEQISKIEGNISTTQNEINTKDKQVDVLKKDYATMLQKTYSNIVLQNKLQFVLRASSFNAAIVKVGYMRQLAVHRKKEAKLVEQNILALIDQKTGLEKTKVEKEMLLKKQALEKQKLVAESNTTNQTIAQLGEKEEKIRKLIEQKNQAARDLNNKIERIIKYEIDMARKRAEEVARKKAIELAKKTNTEPKPVVIAKNEVLLTPKEVALSNDFVGNKGRLPWPVASGNIIGRFGRQEHPTLKGVFIENNGIDLKTNAGGNARAILDGVVVSIFTLPTTQTCIIIKHGDYYSVYSNIATPAVSANQTVSTKQNLGTLYNDPNENVTKVHLEIWKGKDKLNPIEWITR